MTDSNYGFLQADQPIAGAADDKLGRGGFARLIADQVISGPPGQGFVIALVGPWGSGKTSLLNLVVESVESRSRTVTLGFDPWLFSHTEELVVRFLDELSGQLREKKDERLRAIADALSRYGEALSQLGWLPLLGAWAARVGMLARLPRALKKPSEQPSVHKQRKEIREALSGLDRRVLVLIDDLDRLEGDQIRDMLRLVKLVGDFPNVTYLLAFDDAYVKDALRLGDRGDEYLEKVIQSVHHIPEIEMPTLVKMLLPELDKAIDDVNVGYWSTEDWQNLFVTAIRPFFKSVRDIRRYLNAAPITLRLLNGEVAGADALTLEALRVFAPRAYALLPGMVDTLTKEPDARRDGAREERAKAQVEALIDAVPEEHREAARQMIQRLFPSVGGLAGGSTIIHGAAALEKNQRVARPDILRVFLRKTLPENVAPATLIAQAVARLEDEEALTELLSDLETPMLANVIERLEAHVVDHPPKSKEPAIAALFNARSRLPEERSGLLSLPPDVSLHRVVLRMLESAAESERTAIVAGAISRIGTVCDRIDLIDLVGHQEHVGHKLVSEVDASAWLDDQLDQVLARDPIELVTERDFPRVLHLLRNYRSTDAAPWEARLIDSDEGLFRLLTTSMGAVESQTLGDVAVRKDHRLPWESLYETVGEERLRDRVLQLDAKLADRSELDERVAIALDLAVRYAKGDRPPDRGV